MLALCSLREFAVLSLVLGVLSADVDENSINSAKERATDIPVDGDKPLNYALDWGIGVNPGDGALDPAVEGANWCGPSYPNQSPIHIQNQDMVDVYERTPLQVELHTVDQTAMVLTSNGVELEVCFSL